MAIETTIILGEITPINKYKEEKIVKEYKPFVKSFATWNSFRKWHKTATKPLMKDKQLAVIREEVRRPRLQAYIEEIEQMNNPYIHLLLILTPKERIYNLATSHMEHLQLIDLSKTMMDDFSYTLKKELYPIEDEGVRAIIGRVGLSYSTYLLYREDLLQLEDKSEYQIRKVITEKKLPSIDLILYRILNRERGAMSLYKKLCNKYSETWVDKHFLSMLSMTLWLKSKVIEGKYTLLQIREYDEYRGVLRLVRDAKITDCYVLKSFLSHKQRFAIERYLLLDETTNIMEYTLENLHPQTLTGKNLPYIAPHRKGTTFARTIEPKNDRITFNVTENRFLVRNIIGTEEI